MEKKKSNILITGYSGFVGHSLIPLLSQNYNIIGIDNLSLSTKQEAEQLNSYLLNNYYIDFASNKVDKIIKKYHIDTIIHLAAFSTITEGEKYPEKYWENNVDKTRKLFTIAGKNKIKNIIFFSSASIYGNKNGQLNENLKISPISTYAKTKAAVENMTFEFNKRYNINFIILRCFNIISSNLYKKNDTHIIPQLINSITTNKVFLFRRSKSQKQSDIRDYIDIEEIEEFIEIILQNYKEHKLHGNLTLNMGTGLGLSIDQLIEKVEDIFKLKVNYKIVPKNNFDQASSIGDTTKCKKLFNKVPKSNVDIVLEKIKKELVS